MLEIMQKELGKAEKQHETAVKNYKGALADKRAHDERVRGLCSTASKSANKLAGLRKAVRALEEEEAKAEAIEAASGDVAEPEAE